jgi:hypothetical protein
VYGERGKWESGSLYLVSVQVPPLLQKQLFSSPRTQKYKVGAVPDVDLDDPGDAESGSDGPTVSLN